MLPDKLKLGCLIYIYIYSTLASNYKQKQTYKTEDSFNFMLGATTAKLVGQQDSLGNEKDERVPNISILNIAWWHILPILELTIRNRRDCQICIYHGLYLNEVHIIHCNI